jgi:hypothetical protein
MMLLTVDETFLLMTAGWTSRRTLRSNELFLLERVISLAARFCGLVSASQSQMASLSASNLVPLAAMLEYQLPAGLHVLKGRAPM